MYTPGSLSKKIEGNEAIIATEDGTQLFTVKTGEGEKTVVLAHGYGFTMDEWNVVAPNLVALGYRVILFDQRGHGRSSIGNDGISSAAMAADYQAVLEFYDVRNAILVGHSMGGFLAVKTLLTYPELMHNCIAKAVFVASFAGDINKKNLQNRLQIPLLRSGILLKLTHIKPFGDAFAKSLLGENPDPEVVRAVLAMFQSQNHLALLPILSAFGKESYYNRLHEINIPCTVVVGSRDRTAPPFHAEDLARLIPGAKKVTVPGKGHPLNWEAPDAICDAIMTS
jgi:pimeloyl-ACP methyl ester carboxylesterase